MPFPCTGTEQNSLPRINAPPKMIFLCSLNILITLKISPKIFLFFILFLFFGGWAGPLREVGIFLGIRKLMGYSKSLKKRYIIPLVVSGTGTVFIDFNCFHCISACTVQ